MSTFVDVTLRSAQKRSSLHTLALVLRQQKGSDMGRWVTCTWWMLWLSVEMPWLALGGPNLALFAPIGLETLLSPCRVFIFCSKGCFGSEWVFAENAE